jgi:hypothetical protein
MIACRVVHSDNYFVIFDLHHLKGTFIMPIKVSLTAKERRLFEYLIVCWFADIDPTIGDMCKECRTPLILY